MRKRQILFLSKGTNAASTRYRAMAYFGALSADGWKICHQGVHGALSRLKAVPAAAKADVVVILRKALSPFFLGILKRCSYRMVFDLDDAIFCRSNGTLSPHRERRFARMVRRCMQVWAGNEFLARSAKKYSNDVVVLPTSVVPEKYDVRVEKPLGNMDLVWIGSKSTRKYLTEALPLLEGASEAVPDLRLKVIADFHLTSRKLHTFTALWSEESEARELTSAHIGIAPMPDNAWTRGKCGLKVLQYMAAGLPVVASPVGVNEELVKHGVTGFLAESSEDWKKAIKTLASSSDLRQSMGAEARKRVKRNFSVEATYRKMAAALDQLLEK